MASSSNAQTFNLTSTASQVPGHLFPPFLLHLIPTPINFPAKQTITNSFAKVVLFLQHQTIHSSLPGATSNTTFLFEIVVIFCSFPLCHLTAATCQ